MVDRINTGKYALFLVWMLGYSGCFAQEKQLNDSLAYHYSDQAAAFIKKEKKDSAIVYLQKAGDAFQQLAIQANDQNFWGKSASSYGKAGRFSRDLGKYQEALLLYKKTAEIGLVNLPPGNIILPVTYNHIGTAYSKIKNYDQALIYYQKAVSLYQEGKPANRVSLAFAYQNIGVTYLYLADYYKALLYLKKGLPAIKERFGEKHQIVAQVYGNIGIIYDNIKEPEKAITYLIKSLDLQLIRLEKDDINIGIAYDNLGTAYKSMGQYEKALAHYLKSLEIKQKKLPEIHNSLALVYYNLGNTYKHLGAYEDALAAEKKALAINTAMFGAVHPDVAGAYEAIGDIYREKRMFKQALAYYQEALIASVPGFVDKNPELNPDIENAQNDIFFLPVLAGKAAVYVDSALSLAAEKKQQKRMVKNLESGLAIYRLADRLIGKIRRHFITPESKLGASETAAEIYEKAIQVAVKLYEVSSNVSHLKAAFHFSEKKKSIVLWEAIADSRAKQFSGIPQGELEKEKKLTRQIAFYQTALEKAKKAAGDGQANKKIQDHEASLFALTQDYEALIQHFEKAYPRYYQLKYQNNVVSIKALQASLDSESAILTYALADTILCIFTITDTQFAIVTKPIEKTLGNRVKHLLKAIRTVDKKAFQECSADLYATLVKPAINTGAIRSKGKWFIIPDGFLNYLPYEVLVEKPVLAAPGGRYAYRDQGYLIKQHAISYQYSATLFLKHTLHNTAISDKKNSLRFYWVCAGF